MTVPQVKILHEADPMVVVKAQGQLVERMDPGFWDPRWIRVYDTMRTSGYELAHLGEFIKDAEFTSGYRGAIRFTSTGVIALKVRNVLNTGLDLSDVDYVSPDSPANAPSKRVQRGDLLLIRSGVGSIGRNVVVISPINACITGHLYRVPIENVSPVFVSIFLKTRYGWGQLERYWSGVSGQVEIDREDVKRMLVPMMSKNIQDAIEKQFLSAITNYHTAAIEAKLGMLKAQRQGNVAASQRYQQQYKLNLEAAKAMLNDLIHQVEEIIEGKRTEIEPVERILEEENSGA